MLKKCNIANDQILIFVFWWSKSVCNATFCGFWGTRNPFMGVFCMETVMQRQKRNMADKRTQYKYVLIKLFYWKWWSIEMENGGRWTFWREICKVEILTANWPDRIFCRVKFWRQILGDGYVSRGFWQIFWRTNIPKGFFYKWKMRNPTILNRNSAIFRDQKLKIPWVKKPNYAKYHAIFHGFMYRGILRGLSEYLFVTVLPLL